MKNRILTILVLAMLSLPVQVRAVDDISAPQTTYKQPISKRKIAKKFLLAMGGVGASSLIIFLILSLYNKVREGFTCNTKLSDHDVSLETPDDLQSAVSAFLNKTNWKQ